MNAVRLVGLVVLVAGVVSGCTAPKQASGPEPASMVLTEGGKLVTMIYQEGAPFTSIYEAPKVYCGRRGETTVQLDCPLDYKTPDRVAVFYCSNGSPAARNFVSAWQQRRIAEHAAWLRASGAQAVAMSKEEERRVAESHVARMNRSHGGFVAVERAQPCMALMPRCSVGAPPATEALRPVCSNIGGPC